MPIYAQDELRRVGLGGGDYLYVRCTHVEQDGKHTVAVTTDKDNMERLEKGAEKITDQIRSQHNIAAKDLAYYELRPDGKVFRVDVGDLGAASPRAIPEGARQRGGISNLADLQERLGSARLPQTEAQLAREAQADMAKAAGTSNGPSGPPPGQQPWQTVQRER